MQHEFEHGGARYRFTGMSAQVELRCLRRLSPLIAPVVPVFLRRGSKPGMHVELRRDIDVPKAVGAVFTAYGGLSDADTDFIERASLGALMRERDGAWHSVWPAGEPVPAFADIDGATMQCLLGRSLGFVVRGWMDKAGDAMPAEFRTLAAVLH